MELIYAWVEDFRNIKQTGFSFSDRFKVEYSAEDRELKIEENEDYFDYFKFADPDSQVTNISAVVGVNRCGKSNLLELIGGNRADRETQHGHNFGGNHFLIYSSQGELIIEGYNIDRFSEFFSNSGEKTIGRHQQCPIKIIIKDCKVSFPSELSTVEKNRVQIFHITTNACASSVNTDYDHAYHFHRYNANTGSIRVLENKLRYIESLNDGTFDTLELKLDKECVDPSDVETLEELLTTAVNQAVRESQDMVSNAMSKVTGGLSIPGSF